ncbi:hypothetical protein [Dactylosporangium darangshiense]|uniref:hypothetical protein n=1 Tax=Dactylosporangium darangshiense TaxID=579108 RepID=UPI00364061F4
MHDGGRGGEDEAGARVADREHERGERADAEALPDGDRAVEADPDARHGHEAGERVRVVVQAGAAPEAVHHQPGGGVVRDGVDVVEQAAGADEQQRGDAEQDRRRDADGQVAAPALRGRVERDEGEDGEREHAGVGDALAGDLPVRDEDRAEDAEEPVREAEPRRAQAGQRSQRAHPGPGPHREDDHLDGEYRPDDPGFLGRGPGQDAREHEEPAEDEALQRDARQAQRQPDHGHGDQSGRERLRRFSDRVRPGVLQDARQQRDHDRRDGTRHAGLRPGHPSFARVRRRLRKKSRTTRRGPAGTSQTCRNVT